MKEEWKTVIIDGKENPWYSVSNLGNIRSHLQKKSCGAGGGFYTFYNPKYYKDLKPNKKTIRSSTTTGKGYSSLEIKIMCPEDFDEEYQYSKNRDSDPNVQRRCSVHKLVMAAFRPMDEYPPDRLKEDWNDIPESAKTWIKETVTINHIDHEPFNNRVDNLEYVTPKENTRAATKHYDGNLANKGKQNDDEFIVFTDPKWNPLYQEWEDIKVEFHGKEGKECYNMLEAIAKDRGISPDDAFSEVIREGIESERTVS